MRPFTIYSFAAIVIFIVLITILVALCGCAARHVQMIPLAGCLRDTPPIPLPKDCRVSHPNGLPSNVVELDCPHGTTYFKCDPLPPGGTV